MKKTIIIALTTILLASMFGMNLNLNAAEGLPELLITELVEKNFCEKPEVNANKDFAEFIEIYNPTANTIDLYQYSIVRRNNGTDATYNAVTEIRGGKIAYTASLTQDQIDLLPVNPASASLAPGQCAVIWLYNTDAINAGATLADFRSHYGIDESVAVYAVGGGSVGAFGLNNSKAHQYGIGKSSSTVSGNEFSALTSYVLWDLSALGGSKSVDEATTYTYSSGDNKGTVLDAATQPTPGALTSAQKAQFGYATPETSAPATEAPVTEAPVTEAPVTEAPVTEAPETEEPETEEPETEEPETEEPETEEPETEEPETEEPETEAPVTEAPVNEAPVTEAPVTEAPATEAPATSEPAPSSPATSDTGSFVIRYGLMILLVLTLLLVMLKNRRQKA